MSRRSSAVRGQPLVDFSETDLNRLQEQYRRAKGAHQAYTEKTQRLIIRDEQEIQRLQDEREELLRRLRESQRRTDAGVAEDLTSMLTSRDSIDEQLEAERAKVASLKDQILKWERKLAEQRETTHHSVKPEKRNLLKTTLIENKLDRGCKYFNEMMAGIGELREEVKILQADKKQFLRVKSRLEKELHAVRKDISNLMTKCTEASNASVKTQKKQRMLMDPNAKDVAQFLKERSNLERGISQSTKALAHSDHRKVKHNKLESKEFEEAVKKILVETGESDLDKLVRNFIQMEEQNYTLLKFVNDQQHEAETIRRQISELYKEREVFVAEEQRQQEHHRALWNKMSIKQEAVDQQLAVNQRVEFMEKLLDQLKEGAETLLKISCDSSVICDQSESDGNQEEVIIKYLRRLENRVDELLTLQSCCQLQENSSPEVFNRGSATPRGSVEDRDSLGTIAGITPPPVNLTSAAVSPAPADEPDLVESVLLEAEEPMNREDLQTLVSKRIQRKKKTD